MLPTISFYDMNAIGIGQMVLYVLLSFTRQPWCLNMIHSLNDSGVKFKYFILMVLLMQCGDVSPNPGPLTFCHLNARSILAGVDKGGRFLNI